MIPFEMAMRDKLAHRASEMSLAQRDDPIEAFFFDRSHKSLGVRIRVTARVTNSGNRAGAEVVQLYLAFPPAALEPPQRLKGFDKVLLGPGEARTLTFDIDRERLSAWDEPYHAWKIYPGTYTAHIGSSSRDLRVSATFTIRP